MSSNCKVLAYLLQVTVFCLSLHSVDCQQSKGLKYHRTLPWTANQVSNPYKEPNKCGRFLPTFVCNPDLYFTNVQVTLIDTTLWTYSRSAPCLCDSCSIADRGITIGLALLEDADVKSPLSDSSSESYETKLTWQQFADTVRKKWHLGSCDNDVVLVITPSGGSISFGAVSKKILEKSFVSKLTDVDFPKSRDEQFNFLSNIFKEIHSYDLNTLDKAKLLNEINEAPKPIQLDEDDEHSTIISLANSGTFIWPTTIKEGEGTLVNASLGINESRFPAINTWGTNSYIAAPEDDEFEAPEDNKISSSLAFMIVGSLTVILVSLIALFLIIWYYRTKTGNIEPSTMYIKPKTDEKPPSDIKAVKYEPCKTDEPGLPV